MRTYLLWVSTIVAACSSPTSAGDDDTTAPDAATPAANFFVALDGSDAWSGTLATPTGSDGPFATIAAAQLAVRGYVAAHPGEPVTVLVRDGTYYLTDALTFTAADSGTQAAPITWAAYPGEAPVVSGGVPITGWTDAGNGRWTTAIDPAQYTATADTRVYGFDQLFVDDVRQTTPRLSASYLRLDPIVVSSQTDGCQVPNPQGGYYCADRFAIQSADLAAWQSLGTIRPGELLVDVFEKWTMAKMRVAAVAGGVVTFTGPMWQNASAQSRNQGVLPGHRYLVENVRGALGAPGSWFLDTRVAPWSLTYVGDPRGKTVIAPRLPVLITAHDLAYVTFRGLGFAHDNLVVPATGIAEQQASPGIAAALAFVDTHHVTLDHVTLAHLGAWGVEFVTDDARAGESHDNLVTGCTIYDAGNGGVRVGQMVRREDTDAHVPHHNRVEDTVVAGFGRIIPNGIGTGIWIGDSHDNVVTRNEVSDSYNGGIGVCVPTAANCRGAASSGGAFNNEISHNLVHDMGQGVTDDIGCIYVATEAAVGNRVIGNVCHDVTEAIDDADGYGGNGLYLDNSTHGVEVAGNLVYRVTMSAVINNHGSQLPTDQPNDVHDNILAFAATGAVQRTLESPNAVHFIRFHNNVIYLDTGSIQRRWQTGANLKSAWYCWGAPCSQAYDFQSNLYYRADRDLATDPAAFLITAQNGAASTMSFAQWQTVQGEDAGSAIGDPGFADVVHDDFRITGTLPIAFAPLDPATAGAPPSTARPPAVPATFPIHTLPRNAF
jgi:hypothetical protein